MSIPHRSRQQQNPIVRLNSLNDLRLHNPARSQTHISLPAAPPSIADYTFEQYKAASLNIDDQHKVIGQLRSELPLIDRDEIDNVLLRSMAQQLELSIFPACKMMHVDPAAVKRMLDGAFWRAYGTRGERKEGEEIAEDKGEAEMIGGKEEGPRKKVKIGKRDSVLRDIKTHVARRKKAKKGVRVVVFRSRVVSEAWEVMCHAQ